MDDCEPAKSGRKGCFQIFDVILTLFGTEIVHVHCQAFHLLSAPL